MRVISWIRRPQTQWPVLQAIIRVLFACLRAIIPTRPRQILFESLPDCSDNAFAMFEAIMGSPHCSEFKLIWLVRDVATANCILRRTFPHPSLVNVEVLGKQTIRGLIGFLRSRYVFSTHNCYWFARSSFHQIFVNLTHGMPIKTMGQIEARSGIRFRSKHYLVASSALFANIIADCFRSQHRRVIVSGLPRNEWLFQADDKVTAIKNGRSKLVVWLPTFRSSHQDNVVRDALENACDPLGPGILRVLDKHLDDSAVLLLVKLHPLDAKNSCVWPEYRNILIFTDDEFRAKELNLYKLLGSSNALITDYSSVAIDFLLLNRPIGVFAPDKSSYVRGFMPGVWHRFTNISYQLANVVELAKFVADPPPGRSAEQESKELYCPDLRSPSKAILSAVGLDILISNDEECKLTVLAETYPKSGSYRETTTTHH